MFRRARHHALTLAAGASTLALILVLIAWAVGRWRQDTLSLHLSTAGFVGPGLRLYVCYDEVAFYAADATEFLRPGNAPGVIWSRKGFPGPRLAREASMYDRNDYLFGWLANYTGPRTTADSIDWNLAGFWFRCDRMYAADGRLDHMLIYAVTPNWFLALLCLPLPLLRLRRFLRLRRQRRLRTDLCPQCNYDLRGTPAIFATPSESSVEQSPTSLHSPPFTAGGRTNADRPVANTNAHAPLTKTCPGCGWRGEVTA